MPLPSFRMGQTYGATTTPFTPTSLFASGEQGVWYDPSDFIPNWRRNLLTYSEDFNNAAWSKPAISITPNATTAPDGTLTAEGVFESNTGSATNYILSFTPTISATTLYTFSFYIKSNGRTLGYIAGNSNGWSAGSVEFNLGTGIATGSVGWSASITNEGNGWYRIIGSKISELAGNYLIAVILRNDIGSNSYIGDPTKGIFIWGAQLEKGSLTTYQKITDGLSSDYLRSQPLPVLYQDSTGTIPVYGVEQPVGLMLDKSKGLVLGSELVINGGFDTDTDWTKGGTWTISGGVATKPSDTNANISQTISGFVVGKIYKFTTNVSSGTGATYRIEIFGITPAYSAPNGITNSYYTATTTSASLVIRGNNISVDNISVKEIAGNHAKAPADGNRPTLSARVNLLTYTEDFSNAVWSKSNLSVSATKVLAPDGTLTAEVITTTSNNVQSYLHYYPGTITTPSTLRCVAKANSSSWLALGSNQYGADFGYFNLSTGVKGSVSGAVTSSSMTSLGNGWYECIVYGNYNSIAYRIIQIPSSDGVYTNSGIGASIQIWHPDLRPTNAGSLLPPYQRVNAATDYNTVGFPLYLKCNGTSSAMSTSSINFTTTDKITVVSGLRKLSDATIQIALEFSVDMNINNGTFLLAPGYAGFSTIVGAYWTGQIKGGQTQATLTTVAAFPSPISGVNTLIGKTSTPYAEFRLNGNSIAINTTSQGSGTYGNYPLHLFSRANSSLWYNGQFYGAIVRGETTSTPILLDAENYIATKTGITF